MRHWNSVCLFVTLLSAGALFAAPSYADTPRPWVDVSQENIVPVGERRIQPTVYRTVALDLPRFIATLGQAPRAGQQYVDAARLVIELPYPDGTSQRFRVEDAPIMAPALAAKYPELRSYRLQGLDDPNASGRFTVTPKGLHAMVLSTSGSVWIDPYQLGDAEHHVVYHRKDYQRAEPVHFTCDVESHDHPAPLNATTRPSAADKLGALPSNGGTLRTYRLAVAATGEYTAFHSTGAPNVTEALAAIVVAMDRVNGVYERDLSLTMELIANNDQIIYTDGSTDPYTNNSGGTMLGQNQANLDSVIGTANYDIGHVFSTGGGGIATLRSPCNAGTKARGVTGLSSPIGDVFFIDFVAHEIGHQWGGNHTFNGNAGACSGSNRNPSTAYEPGSGSTIQAYAGICGSQNIQNNSDDHFHTISLEQMTNYSVTGNGNSCSAQSSTGNGIPTVDAGTTYTIPLETPFTLCATGSDPDTDPLTFNWEQFNLGPAGAPENPSGDAPIFRSFPSTESPCRTFPQLSDILNGTQTRGEILPTYARTLTFRVTARDNRMVGGAYNTDDVDIEVVDTAGPFVVTAPNSAVTWQGGSSETVTWDVAGTHLAPISCTQVDILLSTDGGQTFGTTVIAGTANDGTQSVTVPQVDTTEARIQVRCSDNVFFDISSTDLTVEANIDIFADGFESGNTSAWSNATP